MKRRLLAGALAIATTATCASLLAQPAFADPGVSTVLPNGDYRDILVDEAHGQVFLASKDPAAVVVTDLSGAITANLTGFTNPGGLSLSDDGSTVYVTEQDAPTVTAIDTLTHTVSGVELPGQCVYSSTFTGGKLWFSYRDCADPAITSLGSYDPATGTIASDLAAVGVGELRALPGKPFRLFRMDVDNASATLQVFDVTSGTPVKVAGRTLNLDGCQEAELYAGGNQVVIPCETRTWLLNTGDLSLSALFTTGAIAAGAASDESHVAIGSNSGSSASAKISVRKPGGLIREYTFAPGTSFGPGSIALANGGKLFAVHTSAEGKFLTVIRNATTPVSTPTLTLNVPKVVPHKGILTVAGTLAKGPGAGTALAVTRTDRNGTHDMGVVTTDAQGAFSFPDAPGSIGRAEYSISYSGDADHKPASAKATVVMRGLDGDINGDGYADTVVGAPGENLGDDTDTGQLHVLYGSATGVTVTGTQTIHQDSVDVPGSNEDGDQFGYTNASGDFNADGYADVAVAAPGENIGSTSNVGEVFVFYGSATGLSTTGVLGLYPSTSRTNVGFGHSVATGDFNGDGRDDLAVGAPGTYAGSVYVYPGTDTGLSAASRVFSPGSYGVPGSGNENTLFGYALDSGDVNGDGNDDLAVGAIYDYDDKGWSTGAATVIYGSANGLGEYTAQRISKDTSGVPGSPGKFDGEKDWTDQFGNDIVLADFNGDGKDDLAVSAATAAVTGTDGKRKADAGTVTVLYSNGTKIGTTGAVELTQKTAGMPGNPGSEDHFGGTITAGDSNNDGYAELVIMGAGEDFITVVPGGANGLVYSAAKAWSQDSPGVPGGSEAGDFWGYSLRFADIKGDGYLSLTVGATGEDTSAGALTVLFSNAAGITGTGSQFFSQDTEGIPGGEEKNDNFGAFF